MIDPLKHAGLVHMVARRYSAAVRGCGGLEYSDLVQAGFLGAIRAAETYDPALGAQSTYVWQWVRQNILREIANRAETVRVSVATQAQRRKRGERARATVSSLDRSTGHRHGTIGSDEGVAFLDMLTYEPPEDDDTRECLPSGTSLESLIAGAPELTENEAYVLRARAKGVDRLEDIGSELGLSRERARQLELSAVVKIREAQGLEIDDEVAERYGRLREYQRGRRGDRVSQGDAPKVEVTADVEREVARLRGQGLGLRAVAKLVGVSHHAVLQIERKLLARLAAALETRAA